ncbi:spiralin [Spiroplasma syrphidicola EA-1]|uniref:Spiralin n=1 Tax=Spiroplasma syrphidicola EA-1 TaxID=1276229 RepID=R4UDN1_9MOLU|nr:spiralin lipoprotein [Spiroplasma syrphidicola]AGM26014.1 spiralin [Spiroplasma syrphidicola EA-1]
MKRLLAILGAVGLTATGSSAVVACNNGSSATSNDISSIKSITNPALVPAKDEAAVEKAEVVKSIKKNVEQAVQKIAAKAVETTDYTYDVFSDDKGTEYKTVNLTEATADVYVKITAVKESKLIVGETGYIKVTLPKAGSFVKQEIKDVKVADQAIAITVGNVTDVQDNELAVINQDKTMLDAVSTEISKLVLGAVITTDYTITNDAAKGDYSSPKTINFTVKATNTSKLVKGEFTFTAKVTATAKSKSF